MPLPCLFRVYYNIIVFRYNDRRLIIYLYIYIYNIIIIYTHTSTSTSYSTFTTGARRIINRLNVFPKRIYIYRNTRLDRRVRFIYADSFSLPP